MYREKDLQTCLFGLVGFRQNDNPDYPTLSAGLLQSTSGLYFQDDHPLIDLEILDQALKNYDKYNYAAYAGGTSYDLFARVRAANNKVYESLDDTNQGNEPSVSPLFWKEVNLFSQRLEAMVKASINKVISEVITNKKINTVTKSLFENVFLFDGAGSLQNKEIKYGRFVGFQVTVSNDRDLTAVIKRLGTQFSQPNPEFKLYIYHSSQETPIKVFSLNLTRANAFQWTRLIDGTSDFSLKYSGGDYSPGGVFYIGYYEDDLVGQAVNANYDFGVAPSCSTCNSNYRYYSSWSQYLNVVPIAIYPQTPLPADPEDRLLWNTALNAYYYSKTFGLNLDVSVRCDVTDLFCDEAHLFTKAIIKQFTVDALNAIAYSTRNNPIKNETKTLALYELDNRPNNQPGALKQLEKTIAALDFDLSGFSSDCLPCDSSPGIEHATI